MSTKFISKRMKFVYFILKQYILSLLVVLVLIIMLAPSCDLNQSDSLGIYLADTGAVVLSDQDIQAYYGKMHTFELNAQAIQKWNSYINYEDAPKLADGSFL